MSDTELSIQQSSTHLPTATASKKKSIGASAKKVLLGAATVTMALTGTGAIYQAIESLTDKRTYLAPGELLDVDGQKLHLLSMGQGGPTVVLEAGMGSLSIQWAWIQPEIAQFTRVVSYDRAGLGWSESDKQPHDARHVAQQLHALLSKADIAGPYVLVGHSLGGLFVRMYASLYPDEVLGMVLLDPSHPDQWQRLPPADVRGFMSMKRMMTIAPLLARLGVARMTGMLQPPLDGLPARQQAEAKAFFASTGHVEGMRADILSMEESMAQVRTVGGLGERPLSVISVGSPAGPMLRTIQAMHTELASLSSRSTHRIVEGADHFSLVTNRAYAQSAIDAVYDMVEVLRAETHAERENDL